MTTTYIMLFLSVLLGAIIVEVLKPRDSNRIQLLLTFSGAYLLAVSILHLLPELFSMRDMNHEREYNIGIFILLGFLIQVTLEYFSKGIEHGHFHKRKNDSIPFSMLVGLCLHSLIEGMPLGGHMHAHDSLLTSIILHKVPVAIVLMTFFMNSGMKRQLSYLLLLIFSIMGPLGVYIGDNFIYTVGHTDKMIAIVIGVFLHISTTILFESTAEHKFSLQKIMAIIFASLLAMISFYF